MEHFCFLPQEAIYQITLYRCVLREEIAKAMPHLHFLKTFATLQPGKRFFIPSVKTLKIDYIDAVLLRSLPSTVESLILRRVQAWPIDGKIYPLVLRIRSLCICGGTIAANGVKILLGALPHLERLTIKRTSLEPDIVPALPAALKVLHLCEVIEDTEDDEPSPLLNVLQRDRPDIFVHNKQLSS
jgi:hypothetical protein